MIGQTLDRYRIDAKLGEGGMGVVYLAHDSHLDRTVAIKILPADKVADPSRKQRFVQEARAASALNHPSIVTIHDIRSDAGVDFIVMEHVRGKTLEQVIPAKGLKPTQALRYGVQIADALARAHGAGIIHRDLKPSNVMVTDEGVVKVLDFGLAKLLEVTDSSTAPTMAPSPLTDAGTVVGTIAYMSPEQAEGRTLDARSDIFSFGSVLYEMLTGQKAFSGESRLSVMAKILNDDPLPPSTLVAGIQPELERTILRCLRKDPARRYQTMADLKVALDDLAIESTVERQPPIPARASSRIRWQWAALVPLIAIAGYVGWTSTRAPANDEPLRAVPLTTLAGVTRSPSFSPDGNQIAFNWTGLDGGNPDIYVQQIGAGAPLRLTSNPDNDYSPMWSPDGRWIAFLRSKGQGLRADGDARINELRLVPPLGGPERRLTDIRPRGFLRDLTLAWCPDSTCVVVTDSLGDGKPDGLFVVSLEAGTKMPATGPGVFADTDPAISPDGKWLVFRRDFAPFTGELTLVPLGAGFTAAGEPRRLTPTTFPAYNPRWTPDSTAIVFSANGALWRLPISAGGTPERLPFVGEDGVTPILSRAQPDRGVRLAYVRSYADVNVWRVDTDARGAPATTPPRVALGSTRRDAIAHVTPDGQQVAFTSTRSGENEIWRASISGAGSVQLTSMSANPGWPRWSPDGRYIAFHSNPEGNAEIFLVPAEGGAPRNLTSHPSTETFPSFSRDGRWVYFSSVRTGQNLIWKIPTSGGTAVQVSKDAGMMAIESPDGVYIYYTDGTSTNVPATLWRIPAAGGAAEKVTDGVNATSFDVVDGGVYYIERLPTEVRLRYFDLASHKAVTVAANLGDVDFGLSASADGRLILFSRLDSSVNDLMLVENFH